MKEKKDIVIEDSSKMQDKDIGNILSLISCLLNQTTLNTQLFWDSLQRQLSFSGLMIVGLSLVINQFRISLVTSVSGALISIIGAVTSILLLRSAEGNKLHVDKYIEAILELEKYLPSKYRKYAVVHIFYDKIYPNLKYKIKPIMFKLSWGLIVFWTIVFLLSIVGIFMIKI